MPTYLVWALLSALFAAMTALLAKVGVQSIDPDSATFIRTVVILVLLGSILVVKGTGLPDFSTHRRVYGVLLLSGLATGASWLCYFRALSAGPASRVAPIDKLSVVLVAILAVIFLGERLSALNWAGVGAIALGAWLVIL